MKLDKLTACLAAASPLVLSSHAQDLLTDGLVAHYPFNYNANDESGQGHDGRVVEEIAAN